MNSLLDRLGHATQLFVTVTVLLAFFACIYMLMLQKTDMPAGVREVLLVLIGVLAGEFKNCCGYWLGSSLSSAKKDQQRPTP